MAMNFNNNFMNINPKPSITNLANINIPNIPIQTCTIPSMSSQTDTSTQQMSSCLPMILSPNITTPLFPTQTLLTTEKTLQAEVAQKNKQIQLMQSRLWSLQADFDEAIKVIQSFKDYQDNKNNKLCTIQEEEDAYEDILKLKARNTALEQELAKLKKTHSKHCDEFAQKNLDINRKNNALKKELAGVKRKMKALEWEKSVQDDKKNIKENVLSELYLNSNRVKEFMKMVKKYGKEYEILKKRQCNLTNAIGMEDNETVKIRMNDLYRDIVNVEHTYNSLYDALDVIKTESQGKEYELMTKDKEYISLLEKEKFVQSSHLDEYVKRNQSLQTDLTDREMKLRQSQNELTFVKQKLNRSEVTNNNLMEQFQRFNYQNYQYNNFCENYSQ